jgi:hypothetical protein
MLTGTPLDLTPFGPLLSAMGQLYWGLALGLALLALWLPKRWWIKVPLAAAVMAAFVYPVVTHVQDERHRYDAVKARHDEAMARFELRCKEAANKVNRTVEGVDGVLLLNLRRESRVDESGDPRANPNWADAALPGEFGGEGYLRSFLFWEQHQDKRNPRGYLNQYPSDLPGYRYVDVREPDGSTYRYRLVVTKVGNHSQLFREPVTGRAARYAIDFVNLVDPDDRRLWIAGTRVVITDTVAGDVVAERTWFSVDPGQGSTAGGRSPWGHAKTCPQPEGVGAPTRFFVDQILRPAKGE